MTTIRLKVDWDVLTWVEFEALERAGAGEFSFVALRPTVAKFMVDEQGQPVAIKEALAILGSLTRPEITPVFTALAAQLRDMASPPAIGGSS